MSEDGDGMLASVQALSVASQGSGMGSAPRHGHESARMCRIGRVCDVC